jgi:hypothetical protein
VAAIQFTAWTSDGVIGTQAVPTDDIGFAMSKPSHVKICGFNLASCGLCISDVFLVIGTSFS